MVKTPGDQRITKLFGFPGLESVIKSMVKHLNALRVKAGLPGLTYDDFISETETEASVITEREKD